MWSADPTAAIVTELAVATDAIGSVDYNPIAAYASAAPEGAAITCTVAAGGRTGADLVAPEVAAPPVFVVGAGEFAVQGDFVLTPGDTAALTSAISGGDWIAWFLASGPLPGMGLIDTGALAETSPKVIPYFGSRPGALFLSSGNPFAPLTAPCVVHAWLGAVELDGPDLPATFTCTLSVQVKADDAVFAANKLGPWALNVNLRSVAFPTPLLFPSIYA